MTRTSLTSAQNAGLSHFLFAIIRVREIHYKLTGGKPSQRNLNIKILCTLVLHVNLLMVQYSSFEQY